MWQNIKRRKTQISQSRIKRNVLFGNIHLNCSLLFVSGMLLGSTTGEGCRVAPYVNMPSMRLAFDRLHMQHLPHVDLTHAAVAAAAAARLPPVSGVTSLSAVTSPLSMTSAAAAAAAASTPLLFYPPPPYFMNFGLTDSALAPNKNSSIADLRLKAKQHAAALGLDYGLKT